MALLEVKNLTKNFGGLDSRWGCDHGTQWKGNWLG